MKILLPVFFWDPHREMFNVPFFHFPIYWYGFFFALGLALAYFVFYYLVLNDLKYKKPTLTLEERKKEAESFCFYLTLYALPITIIGARLGDILFYDLNYYLSHPLEIFQTRKGGLANHGGILGLFLGVYFFYRGINKKRFHFTFLELADLIAISSLIAFSFIRIGNFFNQEIVGTPTNLPWAVVFAHPAQHETTIPRHPVQLYEALLYVVVLIGMLYLKKRFTGLARPGFFLGWGLAAAYTVRFVCEFYKAEIPSWINSLYSFPVQMGQVLSLPFIMAGIGLIFVKAPPLMNLILVRIKHFSWHSVWVFAILEALTVPLVPFKQITTTLPPFGYVFAIGLFIGAIGGFIIWILINLLFNYKRTLINDQQIKNASPFYAYLIWGACLLAIMFSFQYLFKTLELNVFSFGEFHLVFHFFKGFLSGSLSALFTYLLYRLTAILTPIFSLNFATKQEDFILEKCSIFYIAPLLGIYEGIAFFFLTPTFLQSYSFLVRTLIAGIGGAVAAILTLLIINLLGQYRPFILSFKEKIK